MAELRWMITASFLMLLLSFTEAAEEHIYVTVRNGDEATLPCGNLIHDQDKCDSISWRFRGVKLVEHGQIHNNKSDRLSVTERCSLVMKKVTEEDAGDYTCYQKTSGQIVYIYLFTVSITEQSHGDKVSLICSALTHIWCYHKVKWLHEETDDRDIRTSEDGCSANITFTASDFNQKKKFYDSLKCELTDVYNGGVHEVPFRPPQSSGEKPGDDATTTTKIPTSTGPKATQLPSTTRMKSVKTIETNSTTSENNNDGRKQAGDDATTTTKIPTSTGPKATQLPSTTRMKSVTTIETNSTTSENNNDGRKQAGWWRFVYVPLGLSALIITVVAVNMWTRTKGNKTQRAENIQQDDEDEDEGTVNYENVGEPSASVSLH